MKFVSPADPLAMMLLCGEDQLKVEEPGKGGKDKGGKGGKGKSGQVHVSLCDGWVKFATSPDTAQQLQKLRSSLQGAFQKFCQRPDMIPPAATMAMLDTVASLLSDASAAE